MTPEDKPHRDKPERPQKCPQCAALRMKLLDTERAARLAAEGEGIFALKYARAITKNLEEMAR